MYRNYRFWCEFARGLGYNLGPEEIVLISGCVKASEWAFAAYAKTTHSSSQSFEFTPTSRFSIHDGARLWMEQRSGIPSPFSSRSSTSQQDSIDTGKNSCLFVRYYKLGVTSSMTRDGATPSSDTEEALPESKVPPQEEPVAPVPGFLQRAVTGLEKLLCLRSCGFGSDEVIIEEAPYVDKVRYMIMYI